MAKQFYDRLGKYFDSLAKVLRGEAEVASIFPNPSDNGISKEQIFVKFLEQHTPSKCNIFLGGFLFGLDGSESNQIDVIITTDTTPRYNFSYGTGTNKAFGPVEGCLGVASIKAMLNKNELYDSLNGFSTIPLKLPLGNRVTPNYIVRDYANWPYKIIYASNGLKTKTILNHLNNYYKLNPNIPLIKRPDIIYVVGKFVIFKGKEGWSTVLINGSIIYSKPGEYNAFEIKPDLQAMINILNELQEKATDSNYINFNYIEMINGLNDMLLRNY